MNNQFLIYFYNIIHNRKELKKIITVLVLSLGLSLATGQSTKPISKVGKAPSATKITDQPKADATLSTSTSVKLKKDGTPDKRYKENQRLKKDGTPDKRYKDNK